MKLIKTTVWIIQVTVVSHFPDNYFRLIHFLLENTYITTYCNYFETVLSTTYGNQDKKKIRIPKAFFKNIIFLKIEFV